MFEPLETILHDKNYDIIVKYNIPDSCYCVNPFKRVNAYIVSLLIKNKDNTVKLLYTQGFDAKNHKEAELIGLDLVKDFLKEKSLEPLSLD